MNRKLLNPMLRCAVCLGVLLLTGCQTYHAKPLPTTDDLLRTPSPTVPVSQFDLPGLKPHLIDPSKGLDEISVITLAVLNNPDLKVARLQAGVASAQLLEAGLLPDPVVSGGISKSTKLTGYNIGLSEDIQALITRGAAQAAAKAHVRQVNLKILWQEWQVAEKASELFIQSRADDQLQRILTSTRDCLARRYHQDRAELQQGDITSDSVSFDLTALANAETNLRQFQLNANQTRHELNQLLGLRPEVRLRLNGSNHNESLSLTEKQFHATLTALPNRRADLLALQAGYQSQEELVRKAILAQFPSMNAGVEQARDAAEGVRTIGINVNMTLPLFNHNRGQIAIQRATREYLYQTYQARLDQAVSQADQVWHATQIMSRQLRTLEARLLVQKNHVEAAAQDFGQGNMDARTYGEIKLNWQTERAETIRLHASLQRAQVAMIVLSGLPFDRVAN